MADGLVRLAFSRFVPSRRFGGWGLVRAILVEMARFMAVTAIAHFLFPNSCSWFSRWFAAMWFFGIPTSKECVSCPGLNSSSGGFELEIAEHTSNGRLRGPEVTFGSVHGQVEVQGGAYRGAQLFDCVGQCICDVCV